jgi:hypothetical protein
MIPSVSNHPNVQKDTLLPIKRILLDAVTFLINVSPSTASVTTNQSNTNALALPNSVLNAAHVSVPLMVLSNAMQHLHAQRNQIVKTVIWLFQLVSLMKLNAASNTIVQNQNVTQKIIQTSSLSQHAKTDTN